jgi:WD40 repeat protein
VFALDYRPDGVEFATGGKDATVRVYDEATKALSGRLKSGMGYGKDVTSGHSNRIFSVKYHPTEAHTILSGGWDNTVQVWDTRVGHSVRARRRRKSDKPHKNKHTGFVLRASHAREPLTL